MIAKLVVKSGVHVLWLSRFAHLTGSLFSQNLPEKAGRFRTRDPREGRGDCLCPWESVPFFLTLSQPRYVKLYQNNEIFFLVMWNVITQ